MKKSDHKKLCILHSTFCISGGGRHAAAGFTLIELLVVISIIAILAGMVIPTFYYAKRRAKEAKARVTVKQLEIAFKAYLDTYKVWPSGLGHDQDYDVSDDQFSAPPFKIFSVLRGNEPTWNSQGIAFFEFENLTNYPAAYQNTALDPWSNPSDSSSFKAYRVMFDEDYDNKVNIGGQDVYRSVVVWSAGEDRNDDSGENDDVASWK